MADPIVIDECESDSLLWEIYLVVRELPGSEMSVLKRKLHHGIVFHMRRGSRGRGYATRVVSSINCQSTLASISAGDICNPVYEYVLTAVALITA